MTMKANELRIGNLLHGSGNQVLSITRIYNEEQIGIGSGDPYTVSGDAPCLLPIPLTEEWVIKFGFKQIGETKQFFIAFQGRYHFVTFNGLEPRYEMGYDQDGKVQIPIFNVHQLQNLYFALTGEELKINL